jgi:hypothetical protein
MTGCSLLWTRPALSFALSGQFRGWRQSVPPCSLSWPRASRFWCSSHSRSRAPIQGGGDSNAGWAAHRAEIGELPESLYHYDRFRAIRGRVTDEEGKPVEGALVRCVKVESLVDVAKAGTPSASGWKVPIEAKISTGADGRYEFTHLPVGARTFFYSASGRDLAPAIKDLVVVQDGLGAQLDVALSRPKVLRVELGWSFIVPVSRFYLIPHRWWPEMVTVPVARGASAVEFRGLGGPFRKGLIAVSGSGNESPLRVIARYDLDRSEKITLPRPGKAASRFDLPEAGGLEAADQPLTSAVCHFYAAMSPVALFWVPEGDIGPLGLSLVQLLRSSAAQSTRGTVRGFSLNPFLPVIVRSPLDSGVLTWTNEASEFEIDGLPAGTYRARAIDLFGRVTFASGAHVGMGQRPVRHARLSTRLEPGESESREVAGCVRWEGGIPAPKAEVYLQHAGDFRRYLQRSETDDGGFFRFGGVPGGEPYFVFALPPGERAAVRRFDFFSVPSYTREFWHDLVLSPHRLKGQLPGRQTDSGLQLLGIDPGGGKRFLWSFAASENGRFSLANVPHGRYCLQVSPPRGSGAAALQSAQFEVSEGESEVMVKWPSSASKSLGPG